MPTTTAPNAPPPQHMRALHSGNAVRLARACRKRELHQLEHEDSRRRAADLILEIPPELATMPINELLESVHRGGPRFVRTVLAGASRRAGGWPIPENKPLGQLTMRQALVLAA